MLFKGRKKTTDQWACHLKYKCVDVDVAAARYCSGFINGATGQWALRSQRLMVHPRQTNYFCRHTEFPAEGCRERREKKLSCACRYRLNRKKKVFTPTGRSDEDNVCMCACVQLWIVSSNKSVCALPTHLVWRFWCIFVDMSAIRQVFRAGGWVTRTVFGKMLKREKQTFKKVKKLKQNVIFTEKQDTKCTFFCLCGGSK